MMGSYKREHHHHHHHYYQKCELKADAYQPTRFDQLASAINALACTFVFDANTNVYCFFSVFREARRLRESVE
jgi:CRP-like cAMP-binding protein